MQRKVKYHFMSNKSMAEYNINRRFVGSAITIGSIIVTDESKYKVTGIRVIDDERKLSVTFLVEKT